MTVSRILRAAASAGLAVSVVALAPSTLAKPPDKTPPIPAGAKYVAMGSSFASGPGIPNNLQPAICGRSDNNFAHQVANQLSLNLVDVSCGGATVNAILKGQPISPTTTLPPQIAAVTSDTALVTVLVGGNDINYLASLNKYSCAVDPAPINTNPSIPASLRPLFCGPPPVDQAANQAAINALTGSMTNLVNQIKQQAPQAKVVLLDYATILQGSAKGCPGMPIPKDQVEYLNGIGDQLDDVVKQVSRQTGTLLVKVSKLSKGHDVCSDDPWVYDWQYGNPFAGGIAAYHPKVQVHTAAASAIVDRLNRGNDPGDDGQGDGGH